MRLHVREAFGGGPGASRWKPRLFLEWDSIHWSQGKSYAGIYNGLQTFFILNQSRNVDRPRLQNGGKGKDGEMERSGITLELNRPSVGKSEATDENKKQGKEDLFSLLLGMRLLHQV